MAAKHLQEPLEHAGPHPARNVLQISVCPRTQVYRSQTANSKTLQHTPARTPCNRTQILAASTAKCYARRYQMNLSSCFHCNAHHAAAAVLTDTHTPLHVCTSYHVQLARQTFLMRFCARHGVRRDQGRQPRTSEEASICARSSDYPALQTQIYQTCATRDGDGGCTMYIPLNKTTPKSV